MRHTVVIYSILNVGFYRKNAGHLKPWYVILNVSGSGSSLVSFGKIIDRQTNFQRILRQFNCMSNSYVHTCLLTIIVWAPCHLHLDFVWSSVTRIFRLTKTIKRKQEATDCLRVTIRLHKALAMLSLYYSTMTWWWKTEKIVGLT